MELRSVTHHYLQVQNKKGTDPYSTSINLIRINNQKWDFSVSFLLSGVSYGVKKVKNNFLSSASALSPCWINRPFSPNTHTRPLSGRLKFNINRFSSSLILFTTCLRKCMRILKIWSCWRNRRLSQLFVPKNHEVQGSY